VGHLSSSAFQLRGVAAKWMFSRKERREKTSSWPSDNHQLTEGSD